MELLFVILFTAIVFGTWIMVDASKKISVALNPPPVKTYYEPVYVEKTIEEPVYNDNVLAFRRR